MPERDRNGNVIGLYPPGPEDIQQRIQQFIHGPRRRITGPDNSVLYSPQVNQANPFVNSLKALLRSLITPRPANPNQPTSRRNTGYRHHPDHDSDPGWLTEALGFGDSDGDGIPDIFDSTPYGDDDDGGDDNSGDDDD